VSGRGAKPACAEGLGHELIVASAGCGKTTALTGRFIRLLLLGVPADRMIALTFTRKAAGEFLETILGRLADAAGDDDRAARLGEMIGAPGTAPGRFLDALESMTRAMGRLQLGTLDSFFTRMLQCFATETGLTSGMNVLEGGLAAGARIEALRGLTESGGEGVQALLDAFEATVHGAAKLRVTGTLSDLVEQLHALYLEAGDRARWGEARALWGDENPWPEPDAFEPLAGAVRAALPGGLSDKQVDRVTVFLDAVAGMRGGGRLPAAADYLYDKLLPGLGALEAGSAEMVIEKKNAVIEGDLARTLAALARGLTACEIGRRLRRTRALRELLARYETAYASRIRSSGGVTFADLPHLLLALRERSQGEVDYRLDSALDHWMLDEFQDTSRLQWGVIENLVDEVIQDNSFRRTFFYVGDVKQAIYGWRGGDARLFFEIEDRYRGSGNTPGIQSRPLHVSRRSVEPVIAMVNGVFGKLGVAGRQFGWPAPAIDRWERGWEAHTTALADTTGCAELRVVSSDEIEEAVVGTVRRIDPIRRGLSCAVLCRSNDKVRAYVDLLRAGGIPAMSESDSCVCADNPLGVALLSLFQAVAHPEDRFAWRHVALTPLVRLIGAGRPGFIRATLDSIFRHGFAPTAQGWIEACADGLQDAFTRNRAEDFLAAARAFDASGPRDLDAFIETMREVRSKEPPSPHAVQVMTVHKSKGLGFDVVLLPELSGDRPDSAGGGEVVPHRTGSGQIDWLVELPAKEICEVDPVLLALRGDLVAEACFEAFCVWYVAMTRAKRGLYLFVPPPKDSPNLSRLVELALQPQDGRWVIGKEDWFAECAVVPQAPPPGSDRLPIDRDRLPVRSERSMPSAAPTHAGGALFRETAGGVVLGTEVHDRFAEIGWLEPGESMPGAEGGGDAVRLVADCLASPDVRRAIFTRPAGPCLLWCERRFEWIEEGRWVSGAFDRVVVRLGSDGAPVSASVHDFKTDQVDAAEAAARYAPQLEAYRRALAGILGIDPDRVSAGIVHVRSGTVVPIFNP